MTTARLQASKGVDYDVETGADAVEKWRTTALKVLPRVTNPVGGLADRGQMFQRLLLNAI
jgi:hypothetical protein